MTDDVIPAATWIKDAVERVNALPVGWTQRGDLISVCCVCVQNGDVLAPPDDVRTDGYCPTHLAALTAELAAEMAARPLLPSGLCRVCHEGWAAHPKASHAWDLPPVGEP